MKRFSIIQPINVTERSKTYDDIICSFGEFTNNDANNAQKGLTEDLYRYTFDVKAKDLNDVFASGQEENYGNGEIKMVAKKRRSISVGDIIVNNEDRSCWLVSGLGFGKLDFFKPEHVWKFVKVAA